MRHQKVTRMVLAAMFAAITAVASQIIFPLGFTPVPFSCAMIAIYLCGALLDPRTAFFSQLAYLLAGAAGAPVFSYFSGGLAQARRAHGGLPLRLSAHGAGGFGRHTPLGARLLQILRRDDDGARTLLRGGNRVVHVCVEHRARRLAGGRVAAFVPMDAVKILLSAALASALSRALGKARLLGTGI